MDPTSIRYLALGDSFTIGTGIQPDRAFPAVLAQRWRDAGHAVELVNPAKNGCTTDDLLGKQLTLAQAFGPTIVTLLIGANDIVRGGSDDARYREQIRRIHRGLRAASIRPKAIVVLRPDARDRDKRALADELKAHVQSRLSKHKYPRWVIFVDDLPKNDRGKVDKKLLGEREKRGELSSE